MTGEEALVQSTNKWKNSTLIFDEGADGTSFIWGIYGNQTTPSLGMRWNLSKGVYELGFPHTGKTPSWVVIPDCTVNETLVALLAYVGRLDLAEKGKWEPRIRKALVESIGGAVGGKA